MWMIGCLIIAIMGGKDKKGGKGGRAVFPFGSISSVKVVLLFVSVLTGTMMITTIGDYLTRLGFLLNFLVD